MSIELNRGVSFGLVGNTAVFLDINRDRYFAKRLRSYSPCDRVENLAALRGYGLVRGEGSDISAVSPVNVERANHDLPHSSEAVRLREIAEAVLATIDVLVRLKRCGLAHVISRFDEARKSGTRSGNLEEYARVITAFRVVDPLFDQTKSCLTRSIAMHRILSRRSLAADLIIGVRLNPFAAHAWLQHDGAILNDQVERTRSYQPVARF